MTVTNGVRVTWNAALRSYTWRCPTCDTNGGILANLDYLDAVAHAQTHRCTEAVA